MARTDELDSYRQCVQVRLCLTPSPVREGGYPVARARGGLAEAGQVVKAVESEPERFGHLVEKSGLGWKTETNQPSAARRYGTNDCISSAKENCL